MFNDMERYDWLTQQIAAVDGAKRMAIEQKIAVKKW